MSLVEKVYLKMVSMYIEAAIDSLSVVQSDHLATILLEVKTDIGGMSAMDMALEYELYEFTANSRVERINPISIKLIWQRMFLPEFYLTPLGLWTTQFTLYVLYLGIFTYTTFSGWRVIYEEPNMTHKVLERLFFIFVIGYVVFELGTLFDEKFDFRVYFSSRENYFDFAISMLFVAGISILFYGRSHPNDCFKNSNNCYSDPLNVSFLIIWTAATIALWLRLYTFCMFSSDLGTMIQMIWRMMGDITTFLVILFILWLGFAFALNFLMGDVYHDFVQIDESMLTLFMAAVGELSFEAWTLEDNDETNNEDAEVYELSDEISQTYEMAVRIFIGGYVILAALILLNLLVAMMAKTFERIQSEGANRTIFMRFRLAKETEQSPSYMPPPFNVFVAGPVVLFYTIEILINSTRRLYNFVCIRNDNMRAIQGYKSYDLLLPLMPRFLKNRTLQIDEQILYHHCGRLWEIQTNEGLKFGKILQFNSTTMKHQIAFYNDKDGRMDCKISIQNHIMKRGHFWLDLFQLEEEGWISFDQFESSPITQQRIRQVRAHRQKMKENKEIDGCQHWICAYCRRYVLYSFVAIKRLGHALKVNRHELSLVHEAQPIICPHCYRRKKHIKRRTLVREVVAYWMFYLLVWWVLAIFISMIMLIFNGSDVVESCKKRRFVVRHFERHHSVHSDHKKRVRPFCHDHYKDEKLISHLSSDLDEHGLFDKTEPQACWALLHQSKGQLAPLILLEKIKDRIVSLSGEVQLTKFRFMDEFIKMNKFKTGRGDDVWRRYLQPFSETIFDQIRQLRSDELPLHLFAKFPFEVAEGCRDDFQEFWSSQPRLGGVQECTADDIVAFLCQRSLLGCRSPKEQTLLIKGIESSKLYDESSSGHTPIYFKFMKYMSVIQSLFQDNRKLKNMIRDAKEAIRERGIDTKVTKDQIQFLFEDIVDSSTAVPFFNIMENTDLWTILNTLQAILHLRRTVKHVMVNQNSRIYVSKQRLLEMVKENVSECIASDDNIRNHDSDMDLMHHHLSMPLSVESIDNLFDPDLIMNNHNNNNAPIMYVPPYHVRKGMNNNTNTNINGYDPMHIRNDSMNSMIPKSLDTHGTPPVALDLIAQMSRPTLSTAIEPEEQKRMDVFHKGQISKHDLKTLIYSIYKKIAQRNCNKLTMEMVKRYRLSLPQDESLQYILEQLCRICEFCPNEMDQKCTFSKFEELICKTREFVGDGKWYIDPETIPRSVCNPASLEAFHKVVHRVYKETVSRLRPMGRVRYGNLPNLSNRNQSKHGNRSNRNQLNCTYLGQNGMTVQDTLCIVLLLCQINDALKRQQHVESERFAVTKIQFLQFVDPSSVQCINGDALPRMNSQDVSKHSTMVLADQRILAHSPSKMQVYADQYTPTKQSGAIEHANHGQVTGIQWTAKARNANNLYVTVLDAQQHFVTLGEVMQTINSLIQQVLMMRCGGLRRIMNHLSARMKKDKERCDQRLKEEQQEMEGNNNNNNHNGHGIGGNDDVHHPRFCSFNDEIIDEEDDEEDQKSSLPTEGGIFDKMETNVVLDGLYETNGYYHEPPHHHYNYHHHHPQNEKVSEQKAKSKSKSSGSKKRSPYAKNPRLRYTFLNKERFVEFAGLISEATYTECQLNRNLDHQSNSALVREVVLNNTKWLILDRRQETFLEDRGDDKSDVEVEDDLHKDEQKLFVPLKESKYSEDLKWKCDVFTNVLSFHADVITLQQLFEFSVKFALFLKRNEKLSVFLKKYMKMTSKYGDDPTLWEEREKSICDKRNKMSDSQKKQWLNPIDERKFRKKYGLTDKSTFVEEIQWVFDESQSKLDVCRKMNLFYPGGFLILKIHHFMQNTDNDVKKMNGTYSLRLEEFGLWRHSFKISNHEVRKLFVLMRHNRQSLCWHQFKHYIQSLFTWKYQIQFAIERSPKKEDKTISKDALQAELSIPRHYEADWLFSKAEKWHDTKLTWKQITEYLQKSISSHDNIRDFFQDKQRDEEYLENRAEKMETLIVGQERIAQKMKNVSKRSGGLEGRKGTFTEDGSIGDLRRSMERRGGLCGVIRVMEFGNVIRKDYDIDIGSTPLQRIWEQLHVEQNTILNRTPSMDSWSPMSPLGGIKEDEDVNPNETGNGLSIDFVVEYIVKTVPNHRELRAKQILELLLMEVVLNAPLGMDHRSGNTLDGEQHLNAKELNRKMDMILDKMSQLQSTPQQVPKRVPRAEDIRSPLYLGPTPMIQEDLEEDLGTDIDVTTLRRGTHSVTDTSSLNRETNKSPPSLGSHPSRK